MERVIDYYYYLCLEILRLYNFQFLWQHNFVDDVIAAYHSQEVEDLTRCANGSFKVLVSARWWYEILLGSPDFCVFSSSFAALFRLA